MKQLGEMFLGIALDSLSLGAVFRKTIISSWLLQNIWGEFLLSLRDKFCEAFQEVAAKICINIHVLFQALYSSKCLNSTGNSFSNYVMEIVALDMPPLPIIAILA